MRKSALYWTSLVLILGGAAAIAEQPTQSGRTSGPAVGQNVTPSTVTQKSFEGRSGFIDQNEALALDASALAAGAPGVEGKSGAQSGPAPRGRGTTSKFVY
ncbi:hypothetical protein IY145_17255 [Methylosinus sp. H3A]|uniref:hypothetical protein n=1 Tax=Methylosinus sp. H3A TaxID=2785786 RepID=UPI0018C2EA16|nr:hypothetical protein [Methylosinus sp. H3A]MBG0811121.1 hypothetical protein [Methylosinus sp. H3A]